MKKFPQMLINQLNSLRKFFLQILINIYRAFLELYDWDLRLAISEY